MPETKSSADLSNPLTWFAVWDPRLIFGASQRAFEGWMHGMSALSTEVTRFVQTRLQEDMHLWGRTTRCRDAGEALECQHEFAAKAAADYVEAFGKLTSLGLSIASGSVATPDAEQRHVPAPAAKARAA